MEEKVTDNQNRSNVLEAALDLQDALKEFRKAVNEAFDQRKSLLMTTGQQHQGLMTTAQTTAQQQQGVPGLRKHAPHIRDPVWLTSREAATLLRVCTQTLKRWRNKQLIPFARVGGSYRYRYEVVKRMLIKSPPD